MILYREKIIKVKGVEYCDIRSYEVENAIKNNKPIRVVVESRNEYCDYTPKQLKKKTIIDPQLFRSKFYPDQTYRLYSYEWKPQKIKRTYEEEREEYKKIGVYI